jgi:hypothetical protein
LFLQYFTERLLIVLFAQNAHEAIGLAFDGGCSWLVVDESLFTKALTAVKTSNFIDVLLGHFFYLIHH